MVEISLQGSRLEIKKYQTVYLLVFKTSQGFEKYLGKITCIKERAALTKFTISNSTLIIELRNSETETKVTETREPKRRYQNSSNQTRNY